jgi:hypothetical protein
MSSKLATWIGQRQVVLVAITDIQDGRLKHCRYTYGNAFLGIRRFNPSQGRLPKHVTAVFLEGCGIGKGSRPP